MLIEMEDNALKLSEFSNNQMRIMNADIYSYVLLRITEENGTRVYKAKITLKYNFDVAARKRFELLEAKLYTYRDNISDTEERDKIKQHLSAEYRRKLADTSLESFTDIIIENILPTQRVIKP